MTGYTHVNFDKETQTYTAKQGKRDVVIKRSLYNLYLMSPHGNVFKPIKYYNTSTLEAIEKYLAKLEYNPILENVVIRFGHFNKNLSSLKWISLLDLHRKFSDGTISTSERNKLRQILKLLNLSMSCVMKRDYQIPLVA